MCAFGAYIKLSIFENISFKIKKVKKISKIKVNVYPKGTH